MEDNLSPLQFGKKCQLWRTLPLSPVGRVNLVKMVYLPKFTYFFRNTPCLIPKSFFQKLDSIVSTFVWAGKALRLARKMLQLPLSPGGLVV